MLSPRKVKLIRTKCTFFRWKHRIMLLVILLGLIASLWAFNPVTEPQVKKDNYGNITFYFQDESDDLANIVVSLHVAHDFQVGKASKGNNTWLFRTRHYNYMKINDVLHYTITYVYNYRSPPTRLYIGQIQFDDIPTVDIQ